MNAVICPAILAGNIDEYNTQIKKVQSFAKRIQVDLKDGKFALGDSVKLSQIWWPENILADLHLMYENPENYIKEIIELKPNLVIIHAESNVDHADFARSLRSVNIKSGLAVLPETNIKDVQSYIEYFDHVMIFSGNLGKFGGRADLSLTEKITQIRKISTNIEIGWDGGVNNENAQYLAKAGVNVLNSGGYIMNAENPSDAYANIEVSISS